MMFRSTSDSPNTVQDSSSSSSNNDNFGSNEFDFLERLHRVLDDNGESKDPAVCWNPDGLSFQIRDAVRFEKFLIPLYFSESTTTKTMNYETFLGSLRAYGFYRISNDGIHKDTCSHPLFVKGKKELMQRMCRNQEQFLYQCRDSWPMPPLLLRGNHPVDAALSIMADPNPNRPCPKVMPRKAVASSRPIDKRISFRETLLRRRRRNSGNHTVYLDFLSCDKTVTSSFSISRCECENSEQQPRNDEVIDCTTTPREDDQPDVEPLNPLCHEEDGSLYNDLADVLAAI